MLWVGRAAGIIADSSGDSISQPAEGKAQLCRSLTMLNGRFCHCPRTPASQLAEEGQQHGPSGWSRWVTQAASMKPRSCLGSCRSKKPQGVVLREAIQARSATWRGPLRPGCHQARRARFWKFSSSSSSLMTPSTESRLGISRSAALPGGPMQGSATSLNRQRPSPASTSSFSSWVVQSRGSPRPPGGSACGFGPGRNRSRNDKEHQDSRRNHPCQHCLLLSLRQCRSGVWLGSSMKSRRDGPCPRPAVGVFLNVQNLQIDGQRLWDTLMHTAQIGATPKGGICR